MRRILMLIALLALVLNGPGPGAGAGQLPANPSCTGATCAGMEQAEARSLDPACSTDSHHCHPGRPATLPVANVPRLAAQEPVPSAAGTGTEPMPWAVLRIPFGTDQAIARTNGRLHGSTLPEGFPGILARTCVLRI